MVQGIVRLKTHLKMKGPTPDTCRALTFRICTFRLSMSSLETHGLSKRSSYCPLPRAAKRSGTVECRIFQPLDIYVLCSENLPVTLHQNVMYFERPVSREISWILGILLSLEKWTNVDELLWHFNVIIKQFLLD
jgi:hypothetical protein